MTSITTFSSTGLLFLCLFVLLPLAACVTCSVLLRVRSAEARAAPEGQSLPREPAPGLLVVLGPVFAVPVYGLVAWSLSPPAYDGIALAQSPSADALIFLLLASAVAFAVAACASVAGSALVLWPHMPRLTPENRGRVLAIAVIPHTCAILGLILAFLVSAFVESVLDGGPLASLPQTQAVVTALEGFAVATLAVPFGSFIVGRRADLSAPGFRRALLVAELSEVPMILGLVWALLAIAGLPSS